MRFNIGDKVRIRKDLKVGHCYGGLTLFDGSMSDCRGKIVTVTGFTYDGSVNVQENQFGWATEMLELVDADHRKIVITQDGVTTRARIFDGNKIIKEAVAKCHPDDEFDFEIGASLAFERLSLHDTKSEKPPVSAPSQFQVGDRVVGLPSASAEYVFTKEGWVGRVRRVFSDGLIQVQDENGHSYYVYPTYFRRAGYTAKLVCIRSSAYEGSRGYPFKQGYVYQIRDGVIWDDHEHRYDGFSVLEELNDAMSAKFIELVE